MFDHISLSSSLNEEINQITHSIFNDILSKIVPFFEVKRKDVVEPDRLQITIWRMCIACWIPKSTNTHADYVIPIAFLLQQRLHESASMLRYKYIAVLSILLAYILVKAVGNKAGMAYYRDAFIFCHGNTKMPSLCAADIQRSLSVV